MHDTVGGSTSAHRAYAQHSSDEEENTQLDSKKGLLDTSDDPFADPFADQDNVSTPGIADRKELHWS
jgi:hypothetical protein